MTETNEWPKMMYHRQTGKGLVFNSPEDVTEEYVSLDELNSVNEKPVVVGISMPELRARAKVLGIKSFGMKKAALEAEIARVEIENKKVVE